MLFWPGEIEIGPNASLSCLTIESGQKRAAWAVVWRGRACVDFAPAEDASTSVAAMQASATTTPNRGRTPISRRRCGSRPA